MTKSFPFLLTAAVAGTVGAVVGAVVLARKLRPALHVALDVLNRERARLTDEPMTDQELADAEAPTVTETAAQAAARGAFSGDEVRAFLGIAVADAKAAD